MEQKQGVVKYRYPLCGMTEFDLSELFFVNFDTHISDRRILQSIDNEIWKMCDEKKRALHELNEECQKNGYPECTLATDADIQYLEKMMLVYSPSTVERAIRRIQDKKFNALPQNEQFKIAHLSFVEFDKERINSHPGKYYPLCKENKDNPNAKKRDIFQELEKRHNEKIRELEKEAIKEFERINDAISEKENKTSDEDVPHDCDGQQNNGNVNTVRFSIFDLIG